jgi:hypothetical protein
MNGLTASDVLEIWDAYRDRQPIERALAVLGRGMPEASSKTLASLPIGRRDEQLLRLRELTLGARLEGVTDCTECGEPVEFSIDSRAIQAPETTDAALTVGAGDTTLSVRAPTSFDLLAVAGPVSEDQAARRLARRCVSFADGSDVDESVLTAEVRQAVAEILADADPNAEIELALGCPACGNAWDILLDPASFFWDELSALAARLIREVHSLASNYGWSERDILAMSATRRQAYLEMVL